MPPNFFAYMPLMDIPEGVPKRGESTFESIVGDMQRLGLYDHCDNHVITAMVSAILQMRDAQEVIEGQELVEWDNKHDRKRKNPGIMILEHARKEVGKYANKLGLTPNSRSQISLPDKEEGEPSTLQSLIDSA